MDDTTSHLRLRRPEDLIEAVPYLLGFHPRASIVLVGLGRSTGRGKWPPAGRDGIGRVQITARMDIADLCAGSDGPDDGQYPRDPGGLEWADLDPGTAATAGPAAADAFAAGAAFALLRAGADTALGLAFTEADAAAGPTVEAMTRTSRACDRAGVEVLDWFVVEPPGAAPPPQVTTAAAGGVVAAAATYAGLVARPDRETVLRLLDPDPGPHRARLRPALATAEAARDRAELAGQAERVRRAAVRRLFAAARTLPVLSESEVADLGVALRDIEVRDACWLAIERGRLDGEGLWRELARRLPSPYDTGPLFLFGWLRWRAGDGVLAGMAARRALDGDPGYRAAHLLEGAVSTGLDPFRTPRLRKGA